MRTKLTQLKSLMRGQLLANQMMLTLKWLQDHRIHLRKEKTQCQSKKQWNLSFETNFSCSTTNQEHCPYLGSDTSSVSDFCCYCSDVISQGNQWQHHKCWLFSQAKKNLDPKPGNRVRRKSVLQLAIQAGCR